MHVIYIFPSLIVCFNPVILQDIRKEKKFHLFVILTLSVRVIDNEQPAEYMFLHITV